MLVFSKCAGLQLSFSDRAFLAMQAESEEICSVTTYEKKNASLGKKIAFPDANELQSEYSTFILNSDWQAISFITKIDRCILSSIKAIYVYFALGTGSSLWAVCVCVCVCVVCVAFGTCYV